MSKPKTDPDKPITIHLAYRDEDGERIYDVESMFEELEYEMVMRGVPLEEVSSAR